MTEVKIVQYFWCVFVGNAFFLQFCLLDLILFTIHNKTVSRDQSDMYEFICCCYPQLEKKLQARRDARRQAVDKAAVLSRESSGLGEARGGTPQVRRERGVRLFSEG